MKNKTLVYTAFILFIYSISFAQQLSLDEIRSHYKSFNYAKVIEDSKILLNENGLSKDEVVELQTMKAVSHYSLNDEPSSRKSFIEILKLDKNYSLDPAFISPKIISLFETIKKDFNQIYEDKPEDDSQKNILEKQPLELKQNYSIDNSYIFKSLVLPGWGHLSKNGSAKSWIITAAGTTVLSSMIYFIVDANKKEKSYLSETNPLFLKQKYDSFNTSYKTRNSLIAAYAAIWVFTQLDLHIFDTSFQHEPLSISPEINQQNEPSLKLRFSF